jgi:hypothetical protein
MKTAPRARFWLETALALLSGCLGIATLFRPDWIEALTGFEPDARSGSLEWGIVAVLLIVSVVASILARMEWRRLKLTAVPST